MQRPAEWLFEIGVFVMTPGAAEAAHRAGVSIYTLLDRHARGDWSEMDEHDQNMNKLGVEHGYRILSEYKMPNKQKFWLITESDRSMTKLLLPSEY
jgi:hypothetical protein